jgi:hypothetical protein
MAVFLDGDGPRPAVFNGITKAMQGSHPRITTPRKNQLSSATHADHLIVDQVGCHSNQREVSALLANDFVSCGERYQMSETFQCENTTVLHQSGDSFAQCTESGQNGSTRPGSDEWGSHLHEASESGFAPFGAQPDSSSVRAG